MTQYDIVVYGATMPGVAAIRTATSVDQSLSILLVNPRQAWGGISCGGGQNFWDCRLWQRDGQQCLVQGGSFQNWYDSVGQAYDTEEMAQLLREEAKPARICEGWDLAGVTRTGGAIDSIELAPIERPLDDPPRFGDRRHRVAGDVFIDASESGRLTRLAAVSYATGRQDWADDDRQMATTLMFRVGDLDWQEIQDGKRDGQSIFDTRRDPNTGKRLFWGGGPVVANDRNVAAFEQRYPRFQIKPMNAAEHRDGEFWINALLFYDVDGTRAGYDEPARTSGDDRNPWDRWTARQRAESTIATDEFKRAIQSFPGFEDATLPSDGNEDERVADLLYLRETIHAGNAPRALSRTDVEEAGSGPKAGADSAHYERRIGLGYYWLDNNGYTRDEAGPELSDAPNPVYLPYEVLTAPDVENLLLPGYAASISGEAWFEIRVLPNLCVLGDAAGAAAAVAINQHNSPVQRSLVSDVQRELRDNDAILEKTDTPVVREGQVDE